MSHDICKAGSVMLTRVESKAGHHSRHQTGPDPGRGRPHLRRVRGHRQQAHGPLPSRGRRRSRRPKTSPNATPAETVDLVLRLRKQLLEGGHDAGADTLRWHLTHHHAITLSRATIHRILTRHGAVTAEPKKRPKSSYVRFAAAMPNESWQSDFTHYPLTDTAAFPKGVEIITWLDDCTRYALHVSAHRAISGLGPS